MNEDFNTKFSIQLVCVLISICYNVTVTQLQCKECELDVILTVHRR